MAVTNGTDEHDRKYTNIDLYAVRCNVDELVAKGHKLNQAIKSVAIKCGCHHKTLKKLLENNE